MLLIGPLLAPLQRRSAHQRHLMGDLSNTATDIVGGLRVLRGIGGEQVFLDRYRRESQTTRAGRRRRSPGCSRCSTRSRSSCPASSSCSWSGSARGTPSPGEITPGELVAFYGYSAFLMIPLRTATEYANKLIRARVVGRAGSAGCSRSSPTTLEPGRPGAVAARRAPTWTTPASGLRRPARACSPRSSATSPTSPPRSPTGSACCAPEVDDDVRLGGVPLTSLRRAEVRRRIVVSDTGADAVLRAGSATGSTSPARGDVDARARHRVGRATSSRRCPTASTPSSPSAAAPSPAASGSAWCWPARSPPTRRSWCWSSRPPRSTPTPRPGSPPGCAPTAPAAPPSWSPPAR